MCSICSRCVNDHVLTIASVMTALRQWGAPKLNVAEGPMKAWAGPVYISSYTVYVSATSMCCYCWFLAFNNT